MATRPRPSHRSADIYTTAGGLTAGVILLNPWQGLAVADPRRADPGVWPPTRSGGRPHSHLAHRSSGRDQGGQLAPQVSYPVAVVHQPPYRAADGLVRVERAGINRRLQLVAQVGRPPHLAAPHAAIHPFGEVAGHGVRRPGLQILLDEADQLAADPPDADGLGASLAAHPVVGVVAEVLGALAAAGVHWLAVTLAPALMRDQVVCDLAR